jgi:hypothetical protein
MSILTLIGFIITGFMVILSIPGIMGGKGLNKFNFYLKKTEFPLEIFPSMSYIY